MKAKINRGGGFLGALNYVFDVGPKTAGDKLAEKVGGNMSGVTVTELAKEFGITKKLRQDCKNPVWHCSLSLPLGDRLSSEKWDELSTDFMREMGMDPTNFLYEVVRHSDTDHDHIHIVASRIGLDGTLWYGQNDVFKAIEVTQKLEQQHHLTLTPGLDFEAKKERKSLTHGELNLAVRTGVKPPRLICQEAIDAVLQLDGVISAPDFIERLEAWGVRAVPSVASTGTMNGFSFEVEGVSFTGSKLGDAYKWSKLQTKGIEYVKDRDFERLADAKRAAAERSRTTEPGAAAGLGSGPSDQVAGAIAFFAPGGDQGLGRIRPGRLGAAIELRSDVHRDEQPDGRGHGNENGGFERSDNGSLKADQRTENQHRGSAGEHSKTIGVTGRFARNDSIFSEANAEPSERVDVRNGPSSTDSVTDPVPDAVQRRTGVALGGGWAIRFKQASAAKQRRTDTEERRLGGGGLEQIDRGGKKVPERDRIQARQIDPSAYLEAQGFDVKREGKHLSIRLHGDEVYRVTRKDDGHWVTCDKYENGIGDNIALVAELEPGIGFAESVYRLSGAPSVARTIRPAPAPVMRKPPTMPAQAPKDVQQGREYLRGRGITLETIQEAEKSGMLRYSAGGVLFVGLDEQGTAQNIMRRAVEASELVQKRDLYGTDKRYPQMLRGASDTVLIAEGGIDALAAVDIARREKRLVPTILVSGGADVKGFMQTPWVQRVLKLAKKVVVAFEREKSPEVQAKTDAAHELQMQLLREVCGAQVVSWKPPEGVKDMAELNAQQVQQMEQRKQDRHDASVAGRGGAPAPR